MKVGLGPFVSTKTSVGLTTFTDLMNVFALAPFHSGAS